MSQFEEKFHMFVDLQVTPLQLATVYSTMAAGGTHHKPYLITQVKSSEGKLLEEVDASDGESCLLLIYM